MITKKITTLLMFFSLAGICFAKEAKESPLLQEDNLIYSIIKSSNNDAVSDGLQKLADAGKWDLYLYAACLRAMMLPSEPSKIPQATIQATQKANALKAVRLNIPEKMPKEYRVFLDAAIAIYQTESAAYNYSTAIKEKLTSDDSFSNVWENFDKAFAEKELMKKTSLAMFLSRDTFYEKTHTESNKSELGRFLSQNNYWNDVGILSFRDYELRDCPTLFDFVISQRILSLAKKSKIELYYAKHAGSFIYRDVLLSLSKEAKKAIMLSPEEFQKYSAPQNDFGFREFIKLAQEFEAFHIRDTDRSALAAAMLLRSIIMANFIEPIDTKSYIGDAKAYQLGLKRIIELFPETEISIEARGLLAVSLNSAGQEILAAEVLNFPIEKHKKTPHYRRAELMRELLDSVDFSVSKHNDHDNTSLILTTKGINTLSSCAVPIRIEEDTTQYYDWHKATDIFWDKASFWKHPIPNAVKYPYSNCVTPINLPLYDLDNGNYRLLFSPTGQFSKNSYGTNLIVAYPVLIDGNYDSKNKLLSGTIVNAKTGLPYPPATLWVKNIIYNNGKKEVLGSAFVKADGSFTIKYIPETQLSIGIDGVNEFLMSDEKYPVRSYKFSKSELAERTPQTAPKEQLLPQLIFGSPAYRKGDTINFAGILQRVPANPNELPTIAANTEFELTFSRGQKERYSKAANTWKKKFKTDEFGMFSSAETQQEDSLEINYNNEVSWEIPTRQESEKGTILNPGVGEIRPTKKIFNSNEVPTLVAYINHPYLQNTDSQSDPNAAQAPVYANIDIYKNTSKEIHIAEDDYNRHFLIPYNPPKIPTTRGKKVFGTKICASNKINAPYIEVPAGKLAPGTYIAVISGTHQPNGKNFEAECTFIVIDPTQTEYPVNEAFRVFEMNKNDGSLSIFWGSGIKGAQALVKIIAANGERTEFWTSAGKNLQEINIPANYRKDGPAMIYVTQCHTGKLLTDQLYLERFPDGQALKLTWLKREKHKNARGEEIATWLGKVSYANGLPAQVNVAALIQENVSPISGKYENNPPCTIPTQFTFANFQQGRNKWRFRKSALPYRATSPFKFENPEHESKPQSKLNKLNEIYHDEKWRKYAGTLPVNPAGTPPVDYNMVIKFANRLENKKEIMQYFPHQDECSSKYDIAYRRTINGFTGRHPEIYYPRPWNAGENDKTQLSPIPKNPPLFFDPKIRTNENGEFSISFPALTPNKTWQLETFIHNRKMQSLYTVEVFPRTQISCESAQK